MTDRASSWWGVSGAALVAFCAAPACAETIRIDVSKVVFAPVQVSARVGDTIEFVNADIVAHTATARSKEWDVMIAPNKTARLVLNKAGAFDYYCRFHPNMTGRLDVATK